MADSAITIQEFALGESFLHKMDPRAKIIAAIAFAVVVAVNRSVIASAVALVFPLTLIVIARISLKDIARRLIFINGLMVFLWLFLPFTTPGEAVYSFGPMTVTREGLAYAILLTLKSNAIVMAMIALLGTSPIFNLVHALSHMAIPNKLVHLFFFCFRYVHVIADEYHTLVDAAKVRGFKPGTNLHTYRTYGHFVGMLLVRSFDRAHRIMDAMKCRGFVGRFYVLHHYEMHKNDYLLPAISAVFALMLLVI
jgi:cobalt/nickel transport system permease protein